MNLRTLDSHTIDLDLLPEAPTVLDVGCRWWGFVNEILALRPAARVIAMDPDPDIETEELKAMPGRTEFLCMALAASSGAMEYESYFTGVGNFLKPYGTPHLEQQAASYTAAGQGKRLVVGCVTIRDVMLLTNVKHWDVVKLDCECAEFPILESWPGPIATQISVEFHDYVHRTKWDARYFQGLFERLAKIGYRVVQHEDQYVGGGWGHWDSLLALA